MSVHTEVVCDRCGWVWSTRGGQGLRVLVRGMCRPGFVSQSFEGLRMSCSLSLLCVPLLTAPGCQVSVFSSGGNGQCPW